MPRTLLATALNFFLPVAGYLVLGHKVVLSLAWLVGVIGLTYVELGIQTAAPAASASSTHDTIAPRIHRW